MKVDDLTDDDIHKVMKVYMSKGSRKLDHWTNDCFFRAGAEWMQEKMIEKAVEWLNNELMFREHSSGRGSFGEVKAMGGYDSLEEFIDEFKQAMEE